MATQPTEADTAKPAQSDDLKRLRDGIASHCAIFGQCDYDSVNALLTLKRTTTDLEAFITAYFKQYDLSPGRFNILMALYQAPDHMQSLSDLGDYLVVTRANITGLVDGLVEDGMLQRLDDPDDRRVVLAQLTEKALNFLNWFTPLHHKNIQNLMNAFTPEEKRQMVGLCDKLRGRMRQLGPLRIDQPSETQGSSKS
jgi:MarR family 2-MHQ and catechol resistance regulon transcriptional repressor